MSLELKIKRISAKRSQQVVCIVERLAQELNLEVCATKISTTNYILFKVDEYAFIIKGNYAEILINKINELQW